MSDTNLSKRVCELEERVAYLERELDLSVEEQRFERQISRLCSEDDEYEIDESGLHHFSAEVKVDASQLRHRANRLREMEDLGWEVIGADNGKITIKVEQGLTMR